jgi:hypothetical protein
MIIGARPSQNVPPRANSLTPKTNGRIATSESSTLGRSSRLDFGARYSGSRNGPATSRMIITGTAIKNTEPHQKCSSSSPPTSGPTALPPMKQHIQAPIAIARCRSSVKMLLIRARVDGATVAPATPSRARAAISTSTDGANAAINEAAPKITAPISSNRRRPIRSPTLPIVINNPAMTKP